jgi:hypothetical protein
MTKAERDDWLAGIGAITVAWWVGSALWWVVKACWFYATKKA